MEEITKDRRRTSYSGLLDSAINGLNKLASSSDPLTRSTVNQVLKDLLQLKREIPMRREFDLKPPRKVR